MLITKQKNNIDIVFSKNNIRPYITKYGGDFLPKKTDLKYRSLILRPIILMNKNINKSNNTFVLKYT